MNKRKVVSLAITVALVSAMALSAGFRHLSAAGKLAMTTGSGQIHVGDGDFRNFAFTARTNAAGVTTGETEGKSRVPNGHRWHGTIDCLSVVGNVATMSGVVTNVDPADDAPGFFVVGNHIRFQVVDNGEGKNAPPDTISLTQFAYTGAAALPCAGDVNLPQIPIEGGNVQVR